MNIREFASHFTIYVFATDIDHGAGFKVSLSQNGYDAYFFEDMDTLFNRFTEKPPHVLVLPLVALKTIRISDFIEKALEKLPELKFILVAKPEQTPALASFNSFGVEQVLTDEPQGLTARVAFAVDKVCEKIYQTYQNEQLYAALEEQKQKQRDVPQVGEIQLSQNQAIQVGVKNFIGVGEAIRDYLSSASQEDLIRKFTQRVNKPFVFFKYLPMVRSLVVLQSHPLLENNASCVLSPEESKEFSKQISLGFVAPSISHFTNQRCKMEKPLLLPLYLNTQMEGLFAFNSQMPEGEKQVLHEEYSLFSLAYAHFCFERKAEQLEIKDSTTGMFNLKYYQAKLDEEFKRSKRLRQPFCVVKVAVDDFYEIEQTLGESARDALLIKMAGLIHQTSRGNDFSARTGLNEFSLILVNCHRHGAMIRAERLRRVVETTQLIDNGLKVSVSVGISEYPSLSATPEGVDSSSSKALAHILNKGGNRLCMAKAPVEHRPDFEVPVESGV